MFASFLPVKDFSFLLVVLALSQTSWLTFLAKSNNDNDPVLLDLLSLSSKIQQVNIHLKKKNEIIKLQI